MEQNGTIGPKTSKYMLDENQSLRINFEPYVKTVQVLTQLNLLYLKKQKIGNNGHKMARIYKIRRSEYNKALALLGTRTLQTLSSVTLSCSSKRKKPIPHLIYIQGALPG